MLFDSLLKTVMNNGASIGLSERESMQVLKLDARGLVEIRMRLMGRVLGLGFWGSTSQQQGCQSEHGSPGWH